MARNSGNNQKPSIIYWIIDSKGRWYVGKWNDSSFDFMKRYHLDNAYPWINFLLLIKYKLLLLPLNHLDLKKSLVHQIKYI